VTLYAIGDVQGCARELEALLDAIRFEPDSDRLWLVGDLVNRGPSSEAALRRIMGLGDAVTTVLGNHDLHLLAAAAGVRAPGSKDTFGDVLAADDAEELLDWLRHRPLLHWDREARRVLVHAGIPPGWRVEDAAEAAAEVEAALQSRKWRKKLATMYGNAPAKWSAKLSGEQRRRYTINALTRMRYCDEDGALDFEHSGAPGSQPAHLMPWFDAPDRRARDVHIVFGHWAALGILRRGDVTACDSACVWGGTLTAVPLAPARAPVAVPSPGYAAPAGR
jgi:bis(5'-nucleosyl)-tetraphosphatase (symmetrical)